MNVTLPEHRQTTWREFGVRVVLCLVTSLLILFLGGKACVTVVDAVHDYVYDHRNGPIISSPDGVYLVRVQERTQSTVVHMAMAEPYRLESHGSRFWTVSSYDGPPSGVSVEWLSDRRLHIMYTHPDCEVYSRQDPYFLDVQITYELRCGAASPQG